MSIYDAIIERSGPDGVYERVTVEAVDLNYAKQRWEARFGVEKIISLWGESEGREVR